MRLIRRLMQRALLPGEPPVDRTRKELVVPLYTVIGTAAAVSFAVLMPFTKTSGETVPFQVIAVANRVALLLVGSTLLPAAAYIVRTRRISQWMCEWPAYVSAAAVVLMDVFQAAVDLPSLFTLNVLVLDCLLLCRCSDRAPKVIIGFTIAWIGVRTVWEMENGGHTTRYSPYYFVSGAIQFWHRVLVLVVDFKFTRGFARSVFEQKAMVEASVHVSEMAAVRLSRYETAETRALLEGAEGEKLPALLRDALLQLVDNLALYRPYLPQSCLPDSADAHDALPSPSAEKTPRAAPACEDSMLSRGPSSESLASDGSLRAPTSTTKKVSAVAVNTRRFLRGSSRGPGFTAAFLSAEVEMFAREVAAERGVVDLISGDHMFADFNSAWLCTTHKASAARVAWEMSGASPTRTAAACSGPALCGDFGAADIRRFMLIGGISNTLHALERVSAQLGAVLVDAAVGADTEVVTCFSRGLVERVLFSKRGPRPFLLWALVGLRERTEAAEWMYELENQAADPNEAWNKRMGEWLCFGAEFTAAELAAIDPPTAVHPPSLTGRRSQSLLLEAGVVGCSVAFPNTVHTHEEAVGDDVDEVE